MSLYQIMKKYFALESAIEATRAMLDRVIKAVPSWNDQVAGKAASDEIERLYKQIDAYNQKINGLNDMLKKATSEGEKLKYNVEIEATLMKVSISEWRIRDLIPDLLDIEQGLALREYYETIRKLQALYVELKAHCDKYEIEAIKK